MAVEPSIGQASANLIWIDPYIHWVLGAGWRYYFLPGRQKKGKERMPLLIRKRKGTARQFANGDHIRARAKRRQWRKAIQVSPIYTDSPAGADAGPYLTAMVRADYFLEVLSDEKLRAEVSAVVKSVTLGRPLDAKSLPPLTAKSTAGKKRQGKAPKQQTLSASGFPRPVVMGIIDDGIAFAHERFRIVGGPNAGTRVESWWLQDGAALGSAGYGRELKKGDINNLLAACTSAGVLDEALFYRQAGLIDFRDYGHKSAAWRASHGTHVMDLACGFDPLEQRDDRPIVCVQLPVRVTADTSGGSLHNYVVDAITYIRDCAMALFAVTDADRVPVVINLSYGKLEGPHDGTSDTELAIEQLITDSAALGVDLCVVLPAGNSHLSRIHAQLSLQSIGEVKNLQWRVLPDDRTPSFLEVWLPVRGDGVAGNRMELTISSPTGQSRTISEISGPVQWSTNTGAVYAEARYTLVVTSNRGMFRISLAATTDLDPAAPLAPAGIWKIDLKNVQLGAQDIVHAWVQRDDSLYGFPIRGRQSRLDDPNYVRFEHGGRDKESDDAGSLVRRESTINSIATGPSPIVVGGFLRKEMVAARYSAAGAVVPPPRAPDAAVVSDDSRVHYGVLAAGSRSGSTVAMGGTSVAAPQIARLCADNLAAGGTGCRTFVQMLATASQTALPPNTPPKPPAPVGGYGRITPDPIIKLPR